MSEQTPRGVAVGAALRQARESRGISLREFAKRFGHSPSELSRWETGTRPIPKEEVPNYLALLPDLTPDELRNILALTERIDDPLWLAFSVPDDRRQLDALVEFENTALSLTIVQPLLIPGLLQTQRYIRSIMASLQHRGDASVRVAIRLGRQEILTTPRGENGELPPVQLTAYIGESVLLKRVGNDDTMAEQMRHLVTMSELPNIRIRIIRLNAGWTPADTGPFTMISSGPELAPIVHVEVDRSGLFLLDNNERYREDVGKLDLAAADVDESRRIIQRYQSDWEKSK